MITKTFVQLPNLSRSWQAGSAGFDEDDDIVSTALLHSHLTSVVIPVDDIARRIVNRALWQIENGHDNAPGEIVATWRREGGSTPARS